MTVSCQEPPTLSEDTIPHVADEDQREAGERLAVALDNERSFTIR